MVTLLTVPNGFQARVVAARLGSAGVIAQVRGGDGPYPVGNVEVEVPEIELDLARQLLLADEVEAVFDSDRQGRPERGATPGWRAVAPWVVAAAAVVAQAVAVASRAF
jgi:hypothetical protein